jgi:hypothetical protein
MSISSSTLSNEILSDGKSTYYLYVDFSSYYNNAENTYQEKSGVVYSKIFTIDKKYGYMEINLIENNKYLVEIMYNYAKIEVIVDKSNSNKAIISAINILNSIEYNNSIIANILGNNVLNFSEEEFDIFKTHSSDNTFIQSGEEDTLEEDIIPDTDLIN